jgi:hypothetical protein
MTTRQRLLAGTAAVLLFGASLAPAAAIDVNLLGGSSNGGVSISTGSGGGTLATASVGSGSGSVNATIGNGGGDLVTLNQADDGTTDAAVNLGGTTGDLGGLIDLGSLLGGAGGIGGGGTGGGGGGGGGGVTPQQIAGAYGSLGGGEQQLLRSSCRSVLVNPAAFDRSLVALCRVIARIAVQN